MARRLAFALLLALVVAAAASGSALDRAWTAPAALTALDETAASVAGGIAWTPGHCEQVVLWQPDEKIRRTFGVPGPCPRTSTGRGVSAVATLGDRVVWLSYVGGNTRDWRLWTATGTARTPRLIRSASAAADDAAPIVLGNAGEEGIPFAVGRKVTVIGSNGAAELSWQAPARVVGLAEGALQVGVLLADGHLVTLHVNGGKQAVDVSYPPGAVRAFRIVSIGAIVETANGIEIRRPNGTAKAVGAGAHLAGFADGQLIYSRGNELREYFVPDAKDQLLRRVAHRPFLVDFDRRGLAWTQGRNLCWAVRVYVSPPLGGAPGC